MNKYLTSLLVMLLTHTAFADTRIIIKFKPSAKQQELLKNGTINNKQLNKQLSEPLSDAQLQQLSTILGSKVEDKFALPTGAHIIGIDKNLTKNELNSAIDTLIAESNIVYAVEDKTLSKISY